jgi:hypothetical protein
MALPSSLILISVQKLGESLKMRSLDVWLDAARTGAAQAYPFKLSKSIN